MGIRMTNARYLINHNITIAHFKPSVHVVKSYRLQRNLLVVINKRIYEIFCKNKNSSFTWNFEYFFIYLLLDLIQTILYVQTI